MRVEQVINAEIVHCYDDESGVYIYSKGNEFWGRIQDEEFKVSVPVSGIKKILIKNRILRRFLRIDKSNVVFCSKNNVLYIVYQAGIYLYCIATDTLKKVHELNLCKNALHMGICIVDEFVFIGEYGNSGRESSVPIWRGRLESWDVIYEFPAGKIMHIHGIYYDEFKNAIWVTTGDWDGECYLMYTEDNFENVTLLGDGSQKFRAVNLIFEKQFVFWGTDSPYEKNFCYKLNRENNSIDIINDIELYGPIWYVKKLTDGYLIQTSVEHGEGVCSNFAHIYYSENLDDWVLIAKYEKDLYPYPLFKNGVISFSDGTQSSKRFVIFGEALKGLDGKSLICSFLDK